SYLSLPIPPLFCLSYSSDPRDLHSFPTRALPISRASAEPPRARVRQDVHAELFRHGVPRRRLAPSAHPEARAVRAASGVDRVSRSEEHTSELQSRGHLVCRLLLEKKNETNNYNAR